MAYEKGEISHRTSISQRLLNANLENEAAPLRAESDQLAETGNEVAAPEQLEPEMSYPPSDGDGSLSEGDASLIRRGASPETQIKAKFAPVSEIVDAIDDSLKAIILHEG